MESRTVELDGPVHYAEWSGPAHGPTFVLVHGLGGSHVNWLSVAPRLAELGRVLAPDLAGFGRTPPSGRRATVGGNRRLLGRFIHAVGAAPAILIGNSMGGAISALQAAAEPETVAGLVLVDAALPRSRTMTADPLIAAAFATYLVPGVGEQFVRRRAKILGPEGLVRETLKTCCADASRVDPEVIAAHVAIATERQGYEWAHRSFLTAARSLVRRLTRRERFFGMLRAISCPTLIIHGDRDRLVPVATARAIAQLRPDWTLHVLDGVGHVPQLEDPARWLEVVESWLATGGRAATVAASRAS